MSTRPWASPAAVLVIGCVIAAGGLEARSREVTPPPPVRLQLIVADGNGGFVIRRRDGNAAAELVAVPVRVGRDVHFDGRLFDGLKR